MHLFTEETNPAGRYIRFGSVGSFRTQTWPDGIGELIRELPYLYTRHFCCSMYRELAVFLSEKTE